KERCSWGRRGLASHPETAVSDPSPKTVLFDNLQERLGISLGVIDWVVRVFRPSEVFEILREIPNHSFVKRTKISGRIAERILGQKMVEIPIDELPVVTIVVGDEHRAA